jgi:hypothetical protein
LGGGAVIFINISEPTAINDGNGKIDPETESISLTTIETGFNFLEELYRVNNREMITEKPPHNAGFILF